MTVAYTQETSIDSAKTLSLPTGCRKVLLQAEAQNVRYRLDGTNPAAGVGMLCLTGAHQPTEVQMQEGVTSIKVIGAASGAKLNVTTYASE